MMKRLFTVLFAVLVSFAATAEPVGGCSYKSSSGTIDHEFVLWGNVRVVAPDEGADVQVYLAKEGEMVADLIIKWVADPGCCGEWHKVTKGEDFTVNFVDDWHDADLIVMYGEPCKEYRTTDPF